MAAAELVRQGWHLSDDGFSKCCDDGRIQKSDIIIKRALDFDLKEVGSKWLPEDINKGRVDCLEGPAVLQVSKIRVVSAPKDNEESQTAPRLCRVSLTDGRTTCSGVTLEVIKGIGPSTLPGTKILLSGPVEVESSFLLLTGKNVRLLGGNVENLVTPWELKKTLAQQTLIRNKVQEGGPPPFVPFGSKINRNEPIPPKKDFKSLASDKDKDGSAGDDKFLQQRQATIQQALQAKSSGVGVKTSFGGGQKQLVKDKDVASIMEMGFSAYDANSALKSNGGNVEEAINYLLSGPQRGGMGGRFQDRGRSGPRGGEGRGGGRRGFREPRDNEDEDEFVNRPSGPATLFDFIEAKLLSKEDSKKTDKAEKPSSFISKQSAPSTTSSSFTTTSSTSSNYNNSKYQPTRFQDPVFKHTNSTADRKEGGRPNTSQGFTSSADSSSSKYQSRPSSNYNQRESGGDRSYNNGGDFGGRSTNKGYSSESNPVSDDSFVDRRQHTTLPPRFAKQRNESYNRGDVEEHDSRHRGQQSDTRQPLMESNHNDNQPGRYGKNYSSGPPHSSDYHGRNQRQSYNTPHHNKNAESSTNTTHPSRDNYNSLKQNSDNTSASSVQPHNQNQQPDHQKYSKSSNQQNHNNTRNQGNNYESTSDRHHPADRGPANKYNGRNGMNPYQNYRQQQQYQDQPYNQPPPRQDSRGQNYNSKPRTDRRFPDGGGSLQLGEVYNAKYWEDNKFYRAVLLAFGPTGTTVLVQFLDYGNEEEVLISDVRPMQGQGHMGGGGGGGGGQWGYHHHSSAGGNMPRGAEFDPMAFADGGHYVQPTMQFTRGGQGGYGKGNGPRKPTQSFYAPPNTKPQ